MNDVTDAKVSERYVEHQVQHCVGDTKSTQVGGEKKVQRGWEQEVFDAIKINHR